MLRFRHTYTSNLLSSGAPPKDEQELLGKVAGQFNAFKKIFHKEIQTKIREEVREKIDLTFY